MEGGKTVSVGAVYVPNSYVIHLSPEDFERFEGLIPTLRDEFGELLRHSATDRRWQFPGPLVVVFEGDGGVAPGRFEVVASHDADAVAPPGPPEPAVRDVLRLVGTPPTTEPAGGAAREWVMTSGRLTIGRLPACDVSLNDANASRQHAELVRREDGWWLIDLDSTNGTLVNGSLVKERRLVRGDLIQIGSSRLEYASERVAPAASPVIGHGVSAPTQAVSDPLNAD
jgi:hypothetical protein